MINRIPRITLCLLQCSSLLQPSLAQAQGQIGSGHVLGNPSAAPRTATDATLTAMFDRAFCGTNGQFIGRVSGTWQCTAGLTVGSSAISGGTNTRVLFDNAGVLGEYTITGSGNVVMSTGPTISGTATSITNVGTFAQRDASAAFDVTVAYNSTSSALTAGRILTYDMGNVAHTIKWGTTANTITFPNAASYTVASLTTADQTLTGGANVTAANLGTITSGTVTIDCGTSPLQYLTSSGSFTLAAPSNDGSCILLVSNPAAATGGTITFSGFSDGANTGDALTTTSGSSFYISIFRVNSKTGHLVHAAQ